MRSIGLNKKRLAFFVAWTICSDANAYPQNARDKLQPLVETSARRLALAEQVALAKWDSGTPVEDAAREAQVIASATRAGESRGLDPAWVSNFFEAQIEANKLLQYSLLAEWRRQGKAPDHTPVSLAGAIRPQLDKVQDVLIAELAEAAEIRARASCRTDIAKAIGKYVSPHKNSFSAMKTMALNRAMAGFCTSGAANSLGHTAPAGHSDRMTGYSKVKLVVGWYRQTRFSSEPQWIEVRSFVEVIDIFDFFEPEGYFECYRQQENLHTDFCKACNDNAL
jgi:chorismate mutase